MRASFYTFGGHTGSYSNVIASFDTATKQWKKLGKLNQARQGHAVIVHQGHFIVVGGRYSRGTERCTLKGNLIQCTTVGPELEYYNSYPEMMSVPEICGGASHAQKSQVLDDKSWILVLNDWGSSSAPMIIDGKGRSKKIGFNFGPGTQVDASCSIVWRGKMFVFGGSSYKRQISVVDQCRLTKKGELPFDMYFGACAQRNNQEVFVCFEDIFDKSTYKNCRRSNGPLEHFSKVRSSNYYHRDARIAVTSCKSCLPFNEVYFYRLPYRCW